MRLNPGRNFKSRSAIWCASDWIRIRKIGTHCTEVVVVDKVRDQFILIGEDSNSLQNIMEK